MYFSGENKDATRGYQGDSSSYQRDASTWQEPQRSPLYNDMALIFSTAPNYVSYRHSENGSILIQNICQVFKQYAHRLDLHSLLNLVSDHLNIRTVHRIILTFIVSVFTGESGSRKV